MSRIKAPVFFALALSGLGGCLFIEPPDGSASFGYVFLTQDPADPAFAENGQNGADPATFQARADCDSFNLGDPALTQDEFGIFFGDFDAGDYVSFSVRVLDAAGEPLQIRPLQEDATRLAEPTLFGDVIFFESQVELSSDIILDLDFSGAGQFGVDLDGDGGVDVNELQIFVPF